MEEDVRSNWAYRMFGAETQKSRAREESSPAQAATRAHDFVPDVRKTEVSGGLTLADLTASTSRPHAASLDGEGSWSRAASLDHEHEPSFSPYLSPHSHAASLDGENVRGSRGEFYLNPARSASSVSSRARNLLQKQSEQLSQLEQNIDGMHSPSSPSLGSEQSATPLTNEPLLPVRPLSSQGRYTRFEENLKLQEDLHYQSRQVKKLELTISGLERRNALLTGMLDQQGACPHPFRRI